MSSTAPGTARMARMLQNTACRPGNRSLASAYPARLSRNTRPSVMNVATMMLVGQPPAEGDPGVLGETEDPLPGRQRRRVRDERQRVVRRVRVGLERGGQLDEERPDEHHGEEDQQRVADAAPPRRRVAAGRHQSSSPVPISRRCSAASTMMSANSRNAIAAPIPNAEFWKLWL